MRTHTRIVLCGIALLSLGACAGSPSNDRYSRGYERDADYRVVRSDRRRDSDRDERVSERDEYITSTIRAQFARDPGVSARDIEIDTYRGTVALSGSVDDRDEIRRAVKIALATPGVRSVRNEMVVARR